MIWNVNVLAEVCRFYDPSQLWGWEWFYVKDSHGLFHCVSFQTQQKLQEQVMQQLKEQLQLNVIQQTQLLQQGPNKVKTSSIGSLLVSVCLSWV